MRLSDVPSPEPKSCEHHVTLLLLPLSHLFPILMLLHILRIFAFFGFHCSKSCTLVGNSCSKNEGMRKQQIVLLALSLAGLTEAFTRARQGKSSPAAFPTTALYAIIANQQGLSSLPKDISPFEKSSAKRRDVQGDFRKIAQSSIQKALKNGLLKLEIDFPPLLGGDQSKTQFDDFDNVQELNKNRDWCIELLPTLTTTKPNWFILPDLKEVELAKEEWGGQRYRQAGVFTSIEAVTDHYSSDGYAKPWGATFASGMSNLLGGSEGDSGLLGDQESLDSLEEEPAKFHLVCQPGNGGPVEDWINVKAIHETAGGNVPTCIVNGALDKVRDGYYAPFIFPKLAKTFDFYRSFEAIFFLKPVSDKGVYGWVYRVYPEPWQVVLQTPKRDNKGQLVVEDTVALVSDTRPEYAECVQALLAAASEQQ